VAELPDDGLTLPELVDLIEQLGRHHRRPAQMVRPLPGQPQDYSTTCVTSLTATVHLSDGRKLEVEIPEGRLRSRVDVHREVPGDVLPWYAEPVSEVSSFPYTLAVTLADVDNWKVRVHEPDAADRG